MQLRKTAALGGIFLLCFALLGCDLESVKYESKSALSKLLQTIAEPMISDLDEATFAMRDGEWGRAEKHLERFLRVATDPEERWDAWKRLLMAMERDGQDKRWINDYLEAMLDEFHGDNERQQYILRHMAEIQESTRDYDSAISSWMQLVATPGVGPDEAFAIYKRLAYLQVHNKQLQGAEGSLHECLSLPLPEAKKAECLYGMAELNVLRDEFDDAANTLNQVLETEETPETVQAKALFLLADIHEQKREYKEALRLFESARERYPNQMAVDTRIAFLKKRLRLQ